MKKLMKMLLLVAAMMALGGCIVDSTPISSPGDVDVLLRLRTPGSFSDRGTRALDAGDENEIRDIHVLVFNQEDVLTSVEIGTQVTGGALDDPTAQISGHGSFEVTLPASSDGELSKLVVLANLGPIEGMTGDEGVLDGLTGDSYDEVVEALSVAITGPLYTGAAPGNGFSIPMWGETEEYVEIDQNLQALAVNLTRAVARIDVGVGRPDEDGTSWNGLGAGGEEIPFTLQSVYVMRPGERYAIMPDPDSHEAGEPTIVGYADPDEISFDVEESVENFGYTVAGGFTTREIYIPEANIIQDGTPGDANHANRMALVVGGTYQGTTQYYRIDFIDTESGELINVLRNHLYQFSIADVVGPGQPDPQAAYENHSMNIEVNVVGWETEVFEDVKIVRDRYFSLSRRTPFEMPPLGAQTETLTIETNIESFTMTLASAPAITLSSGTGGTLSTSDFRYILAGNNGAYTLTVETLADNLGNPQRVPFDTWAVDADGIIEFEYRVEQEWSEFNPAPHDITLTPGEGGTAASGRDSAPQGTPVRVWARSSQGYVFSGWTLTTGPDGFTLPAGQLSSPEMTFTMPGGAVSIAAFFAEATLTAVIDNAAPWNAHEQYSTGQEQPAEGATGPRTITVTANTPWTATLSDNDNFTLGGTTSGSTDGSFTVFPTTPNAADTDSTRQVTVTVSAAGMARTIVLTHSSIADKEFDFTGEPDDWTDKDLEQAL